jgi:methyl-accepting chemotaxis protein
LPPALQPFLNPGRSKLAATAWGPDSIVSMQALDTGASPAPPDDTDAVLGLFDLAREPTALRRRAWQMLRPLLPAVVARHCEAAQRMVPAFAEAAASHHGYRDLILRQTELSFTATLDEGWRTLAAERAEQEARLGLGPPARIVLDRMLQSALRDRLAASWLLSRRAAARLEDEVGRLLGFDLAIAEHLHRQRQMRAAQADVDIVREAVRRFAGLARQLEDSAVGSLADLGRLALELEASAMTTANHCKFSSGAALESVHRAEAIVTATEELSQATGEIHEQSRMGATVAEQVAAEAEASSLAIVELQAAAQAIHAIVDLISTIANKSNLLALNAAVEAARAGAAGRGFAVVAAEVKSLSARTFEATVEVRNQIAAINSIVDRTATQIGKSGALTGRMAESAADIARGLELQATATGNIASNAGRNVDTAVEVGEALAAVETTILRTKSLRSESSEVYQRLSSHLMQMREATQEMFAVVMDTPGARTLARFHDDGGQRARPAAQAPWERLRA